MHTSLIYVYIRQNSPCHVRSKCQPNAVKVGGCQSPTFLSQPLPSILACTLCPPPSHSTPPFDARRPPRTMPATAIEASEGGGGRDAAGKGGWAGKTAIERNRLARVRGIKTESELEARPRFLSFCLVQSWIGLLERGGGRLPFGGWAITRLHTICPSIASASGTRSRSDPASSSSLSPPPSGDPSLFSVSFSLPDVLSIGLPLIPPSVITTPGSSPCRFRAHLARSDLKDNRPSVAPHLLANPRNQLPLSRCYERKAPTANRPH
jgi:hypothetical protein